MHCHFELVSPFMRSSAKFRSVKTTIINAKEEERFDLLTPHLNNHPLSLLIKQKIVEMFKLSSLLVLVALSLSGLASAKEFMLIDVEADLEDTGGGEELSMLGQFFSWAAGGDTDDTDSSGSLRGGGRFLWSWNTGSGSCGGRSRFFSSCSNRDRFTTGNTGGGGGGAPNRPSTTRDPATASTFPPALVDIVDTALADGGFSTLASLLTKAGLVDTLKGTGPFTVFAPLDSAFPEGDDLDELDAAALADVLKYHVVGEKLMAADLFNGMELVTLQGSNITVTVSDGVRLNAGSPNPATVVTADIQANNGVIHAISDYLVVPV